MVYHLTGDGSTEGQHKLCFWMGFAGRGGVSICLNEAEKSAAGKLQEFTNLGLQNGRMKEGGRAE